MANNFTTLTLNVESQVATITFNRPDTYNAFNNDMSFEFIDALKACRKDPQVRAVVITGAGKAFCSGQDLKDIKGKTRSLGESVEARYNPMTRLIMTMEKPVITRVQGVAAGAGAGVVLASDVSIMSEKASLVFAFINVGLVLDSGTSYNLPRLVGRKKAFQLATEGGKITAEEALELGLVTRVVPADDLDQVVADTARAYADKAPRAVGLIKRMLNRSFHSNLEEMLEMEMHGQEIVGQSDDYKEGVLAFNEKRKPVFRGV